MNRRLFLLFPDREHALQATEELIASGFDRAHMHAIARQDIPLDGLPESSPEQRTDLARQLEFWAWRFNLALFFAALLALGALLLTGNSGWWLPVVVMAVSFLLGQRFSRLPNTHLDEFADAIHHGEILLMVDVEPKQIQAIEHRVRQRHPEAVTGGSSWLIPAFHL